MWFFFRATNSDTTFSMAALAAALAILSANSPSRPEDWVMVLVLGLWFVVGGDGT